MSWPKGKSRLPPEKSLIGLKFNRLTIYERAKSRRNGRAYWSCLCECGNKTEVSTFDLRSGHTKSCGCLDMHRKKTATIKHGFNRTPTYVSWSAMWARCTNKNLRSYKDYGGRGISVCERWKDFQNFLDDMGIRPQGFTLDRLDVNGNYEPNNCRWASQKTQDNNKRTTLWVHFDGARMSAKQAAEHLSVPYERVRFAIKKHGEKWLDFVRAAAALTPSMESKEE